MNRSKEALAAAFEHYGYRQSAESRARLAIIIDKHFAPLLNQTVVDHGSIVIAQRKIAVLKEGLNAIKKMAGQTLLGPDSKHNMGDSAPRYH